ncbi:MAG: hypothetical protein ACQES0_03625 [Bacteroidota bacterium]
MACLSLMPAIAQTVELDEEEQSLLETAESHMNSEKYKEAAGIYSQLLSLHTDEAYFRYKYAACKIKLNQDIDKAIEYLNVAKEQNSIPEIDYYLGLAYHLQYLFDKALYHYNNFNPRDLPRRERDKFPVNRQILMARNGKKLIEYAYNPDIINKKSLRPDDFYYSYNVDGIGGKFVKKVESLQTRYDKKHEQNPIVFISETNNKLMFSSYGNRGNTGKDIYFADRQADGSWGEAYKLDYPVNTNEDDAYPFLSPDGKQLYFSSKGHNSMGGYDLFVSNYNESTGKWGIPRNMDFPINSPLDDILYVRDSLNDNAVFASNRDSESPRVNVYYIRIQQDPVKQEVENLRQLKNISRLDVNLLAEDMKKRDEQTFDNNEQEDNNEQKQEQDEDQTDNSEFSAYENLKHTVQEDFRTMTEMHHNLRSDLMRIKHIILEAQADSDTTRLLSVVDLHADFKRNLNAFKSDINEMKETYRSMNLPENRLPSGSVISGLEDIHQQNQSIIKSNQNYDMPAKLNRQKKEKENKLEALEKQYHDIKEELRANKEKADIKNSFTEKDFAINDSLRRAQTKLQKKYIDLSYQLHIDSLKLRDIETTIAAAEDVFSNLDNQPADSVHINEREFSRISFKQRKERITQLSGERNQAQKLVKDQYSITPWYKDKDYHVHVSGKLEQANQGLQNLSFSDTGNDQELSDKIAEFKNTQTDITQLKRQINASSEDEKIAELNKDILDKAGKLEDLHQELASLQEKHESLAENKEKDKQATTGSGDDENDDKKNIPAGVEKQEQQQNTIIELREELSRVYQPASIQNEAENLRSKMQTRDESLPGNRKNLLETAESIINIRKDYLDQLTEAFNTTSSSELFDAGDESTLQNAENLLEEAEGFALAGQNNTNPVRKMVFYEKATQKSQKALEILNNLSQEKTGSELSDFTPPDIPTALEYKDYQDKHIESITDLPESGGKKQTAGGAFSVSLKEHYLNKTDSLSEAGENLTEKIKSSNIPSQKSELQVEKSKLDYQLESSLLELISIEEIRMNERMKDNNELLDFLAETGKTEHSDIPEMPEDSPSSHTTASNPAKRKIQLARKAMDYEEKLAVINKQEELINAARKNPRQSLPAEWYDIQAKIINGGYMDFSDTTQMEALSTWDEAEADKLPLTQAQHNIAESIRKDKNTTEEKIASAENKIEDIADKGWSEKKKQRRAERLRNRINKHKLDLRKAEFEEERLWGNIHEELVPAASTPVEKLSDQIIDSLQNLAIEIRTETANNSSMNESQRVANIARAKGILSEANNLYHLRLKDKQKSKDKSLLEEAVRHYRPLPVPDPDLLSEQQENHKKQDTKETQQTEDTAPEDANTDTDREKDKRESEENAENLAEDPVTDNAEDRNQNSGTNERKEEEETIENDTGDNMAADTNGEREFYYRIQFAALAEPLQGNTFRSMKPVVDEKITGRNLYRYLAGKFYNRSSWERALPKVKNLGFGDAFAVAYLDGKRLNLFQARQYQTYEQNLPAEFSILTQDTDILAENDEKDMQEAKTTEEAGDEREPVLADAIANINGDFYTIQIGVYSKVLQAPDVKGISTDFYNRTDAGYYRYFHGRYDSRAQAATPLQQVKRDIPDAFITHFSSEDYDQLAERQNQANRHEPLPGITEISINEASDTAGVKPEFRIQLGVFRGRPDAEIMREWQQKFAPYQIIRFRKGRYYHYQLSGFDSYAGARQILRRQVIRVIPDAFMVAYRNNLKITPRDALLILKNY